MKDRVFRGTMILLAALCLLAFAVAGAAAEEGGKAEGYFTEPLEDLFSFCYTTTELPENVAVRERSLTVSALFQTQADAEAAREAAQTETEGAGEAATADAEAAGESTPAAGETVIHAATEFLEGDEGLREAVTVQENGTVAIDPEKLGEAGTASFRLTFETEHLTASRDVTLQVFAFADTPSLTELYVDPVFYMEPGKHFSSGTALRAIAREEYLSWCAENGLASPKPEITVEPKDLPGLTYDTETDTFTIAEFGVYDCVAHYDLANLSWTLPFRVQASAYSITGPTWLMPGGTGQFRVTDVDAAAGRTYTWSVSDNAGEIDAHTGVLTVSRDAEPGVPMTVTLTPDRETAIETQVRIVDKALPILEEPTTEADQGFLVPAPAGDWDTHVSERRENGWIYRSYLTSEDGASLVIEARVDPIDSGFREDDQAALAYYDQTTFNDKALNLQTETIRIDGHYARLYTYSTEVKNQQLYRMGEISYCRNNRLLTMNVYATRSGATETNLIPITIKDLKSLAELIHYDEEQAPVKRSDIQLSLSTQDGTDAAAAGRTIILVPHYANDAFDRDAAGRKFNWTLKDAATGEETELASIAEGGRLTVSASLEAPAEIIVTAQSAAYGTKASKRIRLTPVAQRIAIESGNLMLYVDTEPVSVQATLTPETIPTEDLVWKSNPAERFELQPQADWSVLVKALSVGTGNLTVKEPGGKSAQIRLNAVIPVQEVQLTYSGSAKAGGMIRFSAQLAPRDAGNRNLRWSIDADESVATITQAGKLRINRNAPKGTVITVTCEAVGAQVPVTATEQIEVQ